MAADQSGWTFRGILRVAGAFIAWLIGAGFATGQEILQFFSSYGYVSYGVIAINLLGFLVLGPILLLTGYAHKGDRHFDHFTYYCGAKVGKLYSWAIPLALLLIMSVLISAAGAALNEYYGIDKHMGSACMSLCVLTVYIIGFERLVKLVSVIGPLIIAFVLSVGVLTVACDYGSFSAIADYEDVLVPAQAAPSFALSAVLYLSLNFLTASTYYTAVGRSAHDRKEALWGAVLGSIIFVLALGLINTGILLNAQDASAMAIPMLYLAKRLSLAFGGIFSIVLVLGMFCSSSTTMWSICSRFFVYEPRANRLFAVAITLVTFILGLFSFSKLVSIIFPLVGYMGLVYIARVLWKWRGCRE